MIVLTPSGGDDTAAFQSAMDSMVAAGGGTLLIEAGQYLWTAPVVLDMAALTTFGPAGRVNIIGAGAGCVDIRFAPEAAGQTALTVLGGQWGAGAESRQTIGGFRIYSDNPALGHTGLALKRMIFASVRDVYLFQLGTGLTMEDCVGLEFSSCATTFCNYGAYGAMSGTNSTVASPPNELVFNNWHALACRQWGMLLVQSGNVVFNGGSFEAIGKPGNWTQDANRYGLRIANGGLNAGVALALHGTHFETNAGKCDLWIDNWLWPSTYSIVGCDFMKNGNVDYVQDNIYLENVGNKLATFNVTNSAFVSVNGYVPDASRRAVNLGTANASTVVNLRDNTYQDALERPTCATPLPTSAAGLLPGDFYRNSSGFVKVV